MVHHAAFRMTPAAAQVGLGEVEMVGSVVVVMAVVVMVVVAMVVVALEVGGGLPVCVMPSREESVIEAVHAATAMGMVRLWLDTSPTPPARCVCLNASS